MIEFRRKGQKRHAYSQDFGESTLSARTGVRQSDLERRDERSRVTNPRTLAVAAIGASVVSTP